MLSRRGIRAEIQILERVGEAMICASGQSAFGKVGHQRAAVGGQQGVAQVLVRSALAARNCMRGLAAFYGDCSKLPNRDSWPALQPHLLPYDGMTNEKHYRFSSAEPHRPQTLRAGGPFCPPPGLQRNAAESSLKEAPLQNSVFLGIFPAALDLVFLPP
jgi:hypothetical protein